MNKKLYEKRRLIYIQDICRQKYKLRYENVIQLYFLIFIICLSSDLILFPLPILIFF
jgi:hypothetical protein